MSDEYDVEEGILRSPSLDEANNICTADIEDAKSPFLASLTLFEDLPTQNIAAAGVAAETPPSMTLLVGPEQIRDDVGAAPSTAIVIGSAGRFPTAASAAAHNIGATGEMSVAGLQQTQNDIGSPFPFNSDTAVDDANSFFASFSSLSADSSARNVAAATPPSSLTPLAVPEPVCGNVISLPLVAMVESLTDSTMDLKKTSGNLEQIHDHVGPAPPTSMPGAFGDTNITKKLCGPLPSEAQNNNGQVTPLEGIGLSPPVPFNWEDFDRGRMQKQQGDDVQLTPLEAIGLSPPVPFNFAEFDDGRLQKQQRYDDNILIPTPDEIELDTKPFSNIRTPANIRNRDQESPCAIAIDLGSSNPAAVEQPSNDGGRAFDRAPVLEQDQNESLQVISEAYLVEEEERDDEEEIIRVHAVPLLPLWKRKSVACSLILCVVGVSSIAAGVATSLVGTPEGDASDVPFSLDSFPSSSHSKSLEPTLELSDPPSSSLVPSSSPSSCSYTISTGKQQLNMPLDSLVNPNVAIDGRNMVVTAKDPNLDYVYVMFYSLEDDGWERSDKYFVEEDGYVYPVALSGGTALVGLLAYEQDSEGIWDKVEGPFVQEGFQASFDFDDDMACRKTQDYSGVVVDIFRRDRDKQWVQIESLVPDNFQGGECHVAGNTIVLQGSEYVIPYTGDDTLRIYQYDEGFDKGLPVQFRVPLQHVVTTGVRLKAVCLSDNYLVFNDGGSPWGDPNEVFVYHRQDTNQPFALPQSFKSSEYGPAIGHALALDEDVLVVGGQNKTYIFSEQNGYFEETLTLNQRYNSFQISGRSVIAATDKEVYTFNINRCTQSMPTQTPSLSTSPSSSSFPSQKPSSSLPPSLPFPCPEVKVW
eukprot:CAMPEP_0201868280 /NCGR_PEP_ID=MMETSP0902-20130614/2233_1 /ASSEMBLY_ACC=CAM_ASM_000551 /TAXON_ID=420261 /ORGANISM="Thalassiosira antarctica, Strain CCMP982" /LENGTH=865 /DNA_ID=CAMNT_0048393607 /DNA_START=106 /DNA_END=2700 /DNA_ORIENTATION=+